MTGIPVNWEMPDFRPEFVVCLWHRNRAYPVFKLHTGAGYKFAVTRNGKVLDVCDTRSEAVRARKEQFYDISEKRRGDS